MHLRTPEGQPSCGRFAPPHTDTESLIDLTRLGSPDRDLIPTSRRLPVTCSFLRGGLFRPPN